MPGGRPARHLAGSSTVPPRGSSIVAAVVGAVHDRLDARPRRVRDSCRRARSARRRPRRRAASRSRSRSRRAPRPRARSPAAPRRACRARSSWPGVLGLCLRSRCGLGVDADVAQEPLQHVRGERLGQGGGEGHPLDRIDGARSRVDTEAMLIAPAPPGPDRHRRPPDAGQRLRLRRAVLQARPGHRALQALVHGDRPPARAAAGRRPRPCPSTPTSAPARTATSSPSTRAATREPRWDPVDEDAPPNYSLGRGCDLYELDLTTERERRLPASSTTADEVLPAVWKDGLAFARVYSSREHPALLTARAARRSRRMPGGPANGRPNGLDLYGRRLAFGWEYPGRYDGPASDLRMDDVVTAPRAADRALPRRRADDDLAHRAGVRGRQALLREALPGRRERLPAPRRADPRPLLDRRARAREHRPLRPLAGARRGHHLRPARRRGLALVLLDRAGGPQETCTLLATTPDYE